jgi:hypothetical protein
MKAIKPTRLCCLPIAMLSQLAARESRISFKLYQALARDLAALDLVPTIGRYRAIERVAAFLLVFSKRHQQAQCSCYLELPIARTDDLG